MSDCLLFGSVYGKLLSQSQLSSYGYGLKLRTKALNVTWRYLIAGLIALMVLAGTDRVQAQTVLSVGQSVPFMVGSEFTFNGLTYDLTSCSGGVCGVAGAIIEAVSINNVAQIEVVDPGTSLLSVTVGSSSGASMTYNLNVWAVSARTTVNSATNIVGGSAPSSSDDSYMLSSATVKPYNNSTNSDLISYIIAEAAAYTFSAVSPTQASPLSVAYDLAIDSNEGIPGDVLKLTSSNLILSPAPEPATIEVLATGLTGIFAARRRAKRQI